MTDYYRNAYRDGFAFAMALRVMGTVTQFYATFGGPIPYFHAIKGHARGYTKGFLDGLVA